MTDTTPRRATPEQWAYVKSWAAEGLPCYSCIRELHSRLEALEKGATCPHIVTGDEGTSYCALAEQQARIGQSDVPADTSAFELSDDDPIPQRPAPVGSLSPAAQAVKDAAENAYLRNDNEFYNVVNNVAAAALRAMADQVVPQPRLPYDSCCDVHAAAIRAEILVIATELKGSND